LAGDCYGVGIARNHCGSTALITSCTPANLISENTPGQKIPTARALPITWEWHTPLPVSAKRRWMSFNAPSHLIEDFHARVNLALLQINQLSEASSHCTQ
jgi:hypothetical protein